MQEFRSYYIYLPSLVVTLGLAFYIYFIDRKARQNSLFALITFCGTLWLLALYLSDYSSDISRTFFWSQIALIPPAFIPPLFYNFSLIFPKKIILKFQIVRYLVFAPALGIIFLAFTPLNVIAVVQKTWGTEVSSGPLYTIFLAYFFLIIVLSTINLIKTRRVVDDEHKSQIVYIIVGLAITISINLITNVVLVIFGNSSLSAVGTSSTLIFLGITIYAMVRKHLFDIRILLTEISSLLVLFALIMQLLVSQAMWLRIVNLIIVLLVGYGSYLLIRSVKEEIKRRRQIQKLADELEVANSHLKELDKEKDDFLSMASHELNSPLAAIRGYLSMILEDHMGGKLSAVHKKYLSNISVSTDRLIHLVKDLLNVSRIEQGRIHLVYSQVSINDLINQAVSEIRPNVNVRKHHLSINLEKEIPLTWCDADRITEVIINLLSNSVKYTDEGGKLEVISKMNNSAIEVAVKDNGIGVSRESQAKIFEKFEQGKISRDEKKGTGLGLFIVKNLVELHKGKIWLDSEEGKGSEFHFTVPVLDKKPHDPHEGEGEVLKLS